MGNRKNKFQQKKKNSETRYFDKKSVFAARKMWASSECLGPCDMENMREQLLSGFTGKGL